MPVIASEHGPGCTLGDDGEPCVRCAGFQPGNALALTHGSYARLRLQPRATALREELAQLVPFGTETDGPAIDLLAITLTQVERAGLVLAVEQAENAARLSVGAPPSDRLDRLAADARAWVKTAAKLLDQLGMTPLARARLGLDVANTRRSLSLIELHAAAALDGDAGEEDEE